MATPSTELTQVTDEDDIELVPVSRFQVRAAKELIRLRGERRVHPVVRQVAGLDYERHFLAAIRRHQPEGAAFRRAAPVGRAVDVQAAFLATDGLHRMVFEVTSLATPLDADSVRQVAQGRDAIRNRESQPLIVVVISRTGFTAEAERVAAAEGVRLLKWANREDDPALAELIRDTFAVVPGTGGERSSA